MVAKSTRNDVDFHVIYVENDLLRADAFKQVFSQLMTLTAVSDRDDALRWIQQGKPVDLVIINDELGGLRFLNAVEAGHYPYTFATILLSDKAPIDLNVQAEGKPAIDIFPLDFDLTVLKTRLSYLISKKRYSVNESTYKDTAKLKIPWGWR